MMKITGPESYVSTNWSGGTTTQLMIYPAGSSLQERNFLFRISTATVEQEETVFSIFPDVNRIILPLKGSMTLSHEDGSTIHLKTFEIHAFDGGKTTKCKGKVTDFNLMMRGNTQGTVNIIQLKSGQKMSFSNCILFCFEGEILAENINFNQLQLLETGSQEIELQASTNAVLVKSEIRL
jgi:environmental stress-induced protein Ves